MTTLTNLRQAISARDAIAEESAELARRMGRLSELNSARDAARAELDALANADARALTEWTRNGAEGSPPPPDMKAREAAARKLAQAEHALQSGSVALKQLEADHLALAARYETAQAEIKRLRAQVLAERYLDNIAEQQRCTDALHRLESVSASLYRAMAESDARIAEECVKDKEARVLKWKEARIADVQKAVAEDLSRISAEVAA